MITTKKIIASAMLALAMLGLTTSMSVFADAAGDAAMYCSGCHNGLTVTDAAGATLGVVGGGARSCPQRTASEWTTTIERMNGKGCGVPAGSIAGIANYLAGLNSSSTTSSSSSTTSSTTTTTLSSVTCYDQGGNQFTASGSCPFGSTTNPPPTCQSGYSPTLIYSGVENVWSWLCVATTTTTSSSSSTTTTSTTNTTIIQATCYRADGSSFVVYGGYPYPYCPFGSAYTPPPSCPGGTLSIVIDHVWQCTIQCPDGTTVSAQWGAVPTCPTVTTTTVSSTTTTTLCNTYVNGTTQHPYSGSGSCHGHMDDGTTTGHVVRDQKWCRKHMTHFNSSGNHTHAYPHPVCM